jgi:hypothetical protein
MRPIGQHIRHPVGFARRYARIGAYVWQLVIWSRVSDRLHNLSKPNPAARPHVSAEELSSQQLSKKAISHPAPTLHVTTIVTATTSEVGTTTDLHHFETGFTAVYHTLFTNLRMPDIASHYRYASPSPAFRGIYLWDSAFIAQVWRWWDPKVSADLLRSVVAQRDGDRLVHVKGEVTGSPYTQPPLISWALAELLETLSADAGQQLAKDLYPALAAYHRWLYQNRQTADGLFAWRHPYESGIDNSPRFASRDESHFDDTSNTNAPDFTAYMALNCQSLAKIARYIGKVEESDGYLNQKKELQKATNQLLWHKTDSLYYDRQTATRSWTHVVSIASLLPLWAGIPSAKQAKRLLQHSTNPQEFGTRLPLPSVALNDPAFELDMWRGPVWINTAYAVLAGLRRYGFLHESAELAWRLCDGVYRTLDHEGHIYEFYDPNQTGTTRLTRKHGNFWKRIALGDSPQRHFAGWSALVNNIVIEMLFGLQRIHVHNDRKAAKQTGKKWQLTPVFPPQASGHSFTLDLPAMQLHITLTVGEHGHIKGHVQTPAGQQAIDSLSGQTIYL